MALTPKQENYVQNIVSGMSQREAYRAAYSCVKSTDKTVDNKASALFRKDEIKARYDELVSLSAEEAVDQRTHIRRSFQALADKAWDELQEKELENPEATLFKALNQLGRLDNLWPTESDGGSVSEVQIIDDI